MTVIRRLDAVLESTKDEVPAAKERLDAASITNQDQALRQESSEAQLTLETSLTMTYPPRQCSKEFGKTTSLRYPLLSC